ncbi:EamA family transporter [Nocardioides marmoriginsengisoli]|uniref:EamA family transporter n=1 Tax=Nocardioides marmoriginsengisoli TaxID=661483 RepID=A0A3N0CAN2_9ACTN|nr:EamA family transporter [Nocardioides marmoriginsengisoli]RNL60517.1 EamA family transporter [Nocardioides marmoriginsengisoli]
MTSPPTLPTAKAPAAVGLVAVALAIVYVVWGSTYLGIRVVVEEAPPMVGMGSRYLAAAILLGLVLSLRNGQGLRRLRVSPRELLGCAALGLMLPVLGNGMVAVAEEQGAPSGVTALLIAIAPLMITIFRFSAGDRPRPASVFGVALGLAGLSYLILAGRTGSADEHIPLAAALIVIFASTCWAFGSWVQPRLTLPKDAFVMTVHEMWIGGVILLVVGFVKGERTDPFAYSGEIWLAWGYLVVFGSMIAFSAYVWLLSNAPISLVATYAYVNPVVAVVLGALILDEPITPAILIGGAVIVVAVAIVISVERVRAPE